MTGVAGTEVSSLVTVTADDAAWLAAVDASVVVMTLSVGRCVGATLAVSGPAVMLPLGWVLTVPISRPPM